MTIRRTTKPDIRPANCDVERSFPLVGVGDVPKLGSENAEKAKVFVTKGVSYYGLKRSKLLRAAQCRFLIRGMHKNDISTSVYTEAKGRQIRHLIFTNLTLSLLSENVCDAEK